MEEIKSSAAPGAKVDDPERSKLVRNRLMLAAVLASVAVVPYTYPIIKAVARAEQPASELVSSLASNAIIETLVSWGLIALGLRLRRLLGLGLTLLNDWSPADDEARAESGTRSRSPWSWVSDWGSSLQSQTTIFQPLMTNPQRAVPTPPAWTGLLASVGAGIQEEIWLRLGIMTSAVWIGTQIVRRTPPALAVVWTANLLAAALFGAPHIPQAVFVLGYSAPLVAFVLLGNGVPGLVFGWLYWGHGLVAAMICHFAADLVLKAVLPLLGMG